MPKDLRPNLKTWSSQEKNFIIPLLTEGNPHNNFLTLQLKKAIDICMYIFLGIFTLEMMVKVRKTLPISIQKYQVQRWMLWSIPLKLHCY